MEAKRKGRITDAGRRTDGEGQAPEEVDRKVAVITSTLQTRKIRLTKVK